MGRLKLGLVDLGINNLLEDRVQLHSQHQLTSGLELSSHVGLLAVKLSRCEIDEVLVLDGDTDAGLDLALALVELTFGILSQVNGEDLLLSLRVLDNKLENAVDLEEISI